MVGRQRRFLAATLVVLYILAVVAPVAVAAEQELELQAEMLAFINKERVAAELDPLVVSDDLTTVALAHANDMIQRDFFSHWNPDQLSPADRAKAADIAYRVIGENLAGNTSVSHAHGMLMESPGHRANILEPRFQKVGIGIIAGGRYGYMMVLMFSD